MTEDQELPSGDVERQHHEEATERVNLASPPNHPHHQNALQKIVSGMDLADAQERYQLEEDDNRQPTKFDPNSSSSSVKSADKRTVSFTKDDPENPFNWSKGKKAGIVFIGCVIVLNSTLGSSLPSNAIPFITAHWGVTSETQSVLPISIFLVGYVLGPLLFGPLSEVFGRKVIMLTTFFFFTIFTMACALAPNWPALLVFRFLTGVNASSPITVVGGIYADIYKDPVTRGRAMALFMAGTCLGPLVAPIISGFVSSSYLGWRWTFWIGLIIAGASWPALLMLPETYGPIILARRAQKLRKLTGNEDVFAPFEREKKGSKQVITVTLTRPIRMLFFEAIVLASCLYLSLAYAIFYMFFEAYPIVFQEIYGMSPGISGLMFLPIGAGAMIAVAIFVTYDVYLQNAKKARKAWTEIEEARRLPLACLGGPLYVIALFWLGWTSRTSIPFVVPMLAGIPFGMGFVLIFMALLNYLTDAYVIFAASAQAATSFSRSIFGAVLPLAARPMYNRLGVGWASSLLAFFALAMCAIPFLFIKFGKTLRQRSTFCTYLRELQAEEEKKAAARNGETLEKRLTAIEESV